MPKASVEDLMQMFDASLCIHKNKPYYIKRVGNDRKARCVNLITQREETIAIDEENFTAPTQRLGFVNVHGGVVYCHRIPIRRYKTGLSNENFSVKHFGCKYDDGAGVAVAHINTLRSVELADCIKGTYPSFKEAFDMIQAKERTMVAFDRQFAIDNKLAVYYKTEKVGALVSKGKKPCIVFNAGYEHLEILLDNNCEKTLSASGK